MSIQRGENPLADALQSCQAYEDDAGGDSWGYAVPTAEGLLINHGMGEIPPDAGQIDVTHDIALGHTRNATRGEVKIENAHPFPVVNADDELVAALAHNGTWDDAPETEHRCDSYYIARLLERTLRERPHDSFEEALRRTGETVGETLVVIHRDGRAWAYAGRREITHEQNGRVVMSTGGTRIPEGELFELSGRERSMTPQ